MSAAVLIICELISPAPATPIIFPPRTLNVNDISAFVSASTTPAYRSAPEPSPSPGTPTRIYAEPVLK